MSEKYDDLERRTLETFDRIGGIFEEHSRIVVGTLAIAFLLTFAGIINPSIPAWWPLIPWMFAAAGATAFIVSGAIYALIPEKDGILLVSLRGDEPGGEIWEIYEDTHEDMTVDGTLYSWDESPRRVYELRDYDPEENHAIANWREAEPASAILEERTPEDAVEQVAELRQVYEPEAARARRLLRRIRGIIRRLDKERTEARAEQLDKATGLEGIDSKPISEILDEELPDDLHPEAGRGDMETNETTDGTQQNGDSSRVDIELDDDEALNFEPDYDREAVGM
jgi:hypothetical protein